MKRLLISVLCLSVLILVFHKRKEQPKPVEPSSESKQDVQLSIQPKVAGSGTEIEAAKPVAPPRTADGKMADFSRIEKLALASSADRKQYLAYLEDPILINRAAETLLAKPSMGALEEIKPRLIAVDFLASALSVEDNPAQETLVREVSKVLFLKDKTLTVAQKKALAADKAEIFAAIAEYHPELAKNFEKRVAGTKLATLFKFSRGYFKVNRNENEVEGSNEKM